MSEIWTFGLENLTKLSRDFGYWGRSVCSIVQLFYKRPKSERSVGQVDQPNVWNQNKIVRISDSACNPNSLGMGQFWKAPKSECSDFRHLLYLPRGKWFLVVLAILQRDKTGNDRRLEQRSSHWILTLGPVEKVVQNLRLALNKLLEESFKRKNSAVEALQFSW